MRAEVKSTDARKRLTVRDFGLTHRCAFIGPTRSGRALPSAGELHPLLVKAKFHLTHRTVSVLADKEIGEVRIVGVRFIVPFPVEHEYVIGVLFDGTGIPEIR